MVRSMFKTVVLACSLVIGLPAAAQPADPASRLAVAGAAADVATTALGLSLGAAEANPLGLAVVPLKFIVKSRIDQIRDPHERREQLAQYTGVQFGAAAANICTLALANPVAAALCFAGGMVLGYHRVRSLPTSEEECVRRHLAMFERGAATGRVYKVELKTCTGQFEPMKVALAPPGPGH
jgi:hypothetical protein